MLETMKNRRDELKEELVRGQARLTELERSAEALRETMQRIAGAIQVLDEIIAEQEKPKED
ncbi:hypothetical protein [Azospirillum soli]|uniref:hypothetical protein n=1 Tax=Azospirillum soli TaxID=1304799 RepID=UPI001AE45CFA|nr:hypothetical protein [Azospirillum soli]MBP2313503.1 prefoldin subunit 5 [Azospirillum soli]